MKFLIIGFLFLTAFVYSTESATVEELVRRGQQLLQFATNEVRVLRAEGKNLSAEGLEREETILLELVVELQAAAKSGERSAERRFEERLQEFEERFGAELRKLGRDFVTEREKQALIQRAQQILNRATSEIRHLKEQNKTLEAEGLEREEYFLIQLEVQLRAEHEPQIVRRLEGYLKATEQRVEQELKQLGRSLKKRDLRDDLVQRAKALQTRVDAEVKVLRSQNRTGAVELISREEKNITETVQQLQKATVESEIKALEQKLEEQERRLNQDLRTLGRPINVQEIRNVLTRRAQGLITRANDEIKVLKQAGKTQEVEVIQREERAINELVAQLKNTTQEEEVRQVEQKLYEAEVKLFDELRNNGRPVVNRDELFRVIRRAEELAVRATIEIRKLREQKKGLLAEGLEREERYLIELDVELRAASTPDEVQRLEQRLNEAEKRVEQELKSLNSTLILKKRDVRDDLVKRAEELEKRANQEVKTLTAEKRTQAVKLIQREETRIQELVQELKNATEAKEVKKLEERLREREDRLSEDLRRLGRPVVSTELRDNLLKKAEQLTTRANQEIKTLQSQNKTELVKGLQTEENQIAELVEELKNATKEPEIRKLEERLGLAEFKLGEELKQLGLPFVNPERDALIRRAEEISVRATVEIRKLREEGRALVAAGLEREERYLIELDVELRSAVSQEQIKRLEQRLNEAEQRVQQELKQLGTSFY